MDADFELASNLTLSPKNGPLVRRPGPGKDGQNNAKTPLLLWRSPQKSSHLKRKTNFFRFWLQDLLNP